MVCMHATCERAAIASFVPATWWSHERFEKFFGIGWSMLPNCAKMPIAQFQKIQYDFPDIRSADLSGEQQYLKDICIAVDSGHCSVSLSHREPGKLVMSRWVTLANRILWHRTLWKSYQSLLWRCMVQCRFRLSRSRYVRRSQNPCGRQSKSHDIFL